jgi:hypothetical protein
VKPIFSIVAKSGAVFLVIFHGELLGCIVFFFGKRG